MEGVGCFPRPPAAFFFGLVGAGAVGTDAGTVGAGLFEMAVLGFVTGRASFIFGGTTTSEFGAVQMRGTVKICRPPGF
jgi:hypothetical protein